MVQVKREMLQEKCFKMRRLKDAVKEMLQAETIERCFTRNTLS